MRLSVQAWFLSHWLRVRDVYVFSGPSDESSQRTRGIWRGACPWKREADNTNRRAWISWVAYIFGPEYTAVCAAYRDWRDRIINRMTAENCVDCAMTMVIYRWAECRVTWRGASRKRVGRGQGRRGGEECKRLRWPVRWRGGYWRLDIAPASRAGAKIGLGRGA